jgi:hypothetical protein
MKHSVAFFSKRTLLGKLLFFRYYSPIEAYLTNSRYRYIRYSYGLGVILPVASEYSIIKTKDFVVAFVIVEDDNEM